MYEDPQGRTALHAAVESGDLERVTMLLEDGASVHIGDINGVTPLHVAALHGFEAIARLLLTHHANVNAEDALGTTPLRMAELAHQTALAQLLLQRGALRTTLPVHGSIPRQPGLFGTTIDELSEEEEEEEGTSSSSSTQLLQDDLSLLHLAVLRNDLTGAQALLNTMCTADVRDSEGNTPLHYAVQRGTQEMVKLLKRNSADDDIKN